VLEVAMEWMFAEPTIMEAIASVLRVLHEYERAGGFAPPRRVGGGGDGS
jgi:hypothetical protein